RELVALFEQGALRHPPLTAFDVREAEAAFRHLREARHVGKLVLTLPPAPAPDALVAITGATGGLGALFGRHLAAAGARRLLLLSRRGPDADGAAELVAELEAEGAEVELRALDVADREALGALFRERRPALCLHAAGVLADGVVESLDAAALERVMGPKADAALWLDEALDGELILFSSIAGTLGSPGQANYAAANAFLDALAERRRRQGRAASALAWGPWEPSGGMTAALSAGDRARWERLGLRALEPADGLALFERARASGRPALVPARFDERALRAQAAAGTLAPPLRGLVRAPARRRADRHRRHGLPLPRRGALAGRAVAAARAGRRRHLGVPPGPGLGPRGPVRPRPRRPRHELRPRRRLRGRRRRVRRRLLR